MRATMFRLLVVWGVLAGGSTAHAQSSAPPDTARGETLLERLQRTDREFYSDDIVVLDRAVADSGLAALDSLGFEAFERETLKGARRSGVSFTFADQLGLYNRVEGGIAGAGLKARVPFATGPELTLQGAYASGPRKFRHYEALRVPTGLRLRSPVVEVGYADRVVPYYVDGYSANLLYSFFGSDDEESYLRRRGAWVGLSAERGPLGRWSVRYEAAEEDSARRRTDFGLFGSEREMSLNSPVDEGADRAVEATWGAGTVLFGRQEIALRHRVAGGALGGDFAYSRFAAQASARRFLLGNLEGVLDVAYVRVGGYAPEQRRADLGGLATVRGFDPRTQVGTESLRARFELLVPIDVFKRARVPLLRRAGLQFVPWADAGRVWGDPARNGSGASRIWLTSAGLGVQKYLGPFGEASFLRFDVAAPIGPDRREDARYYLYFARGLF